MPRSPVWPREGEAVGIVLFVGADVTAFLGVAETLNRWWSDDLPRHVYVRYRANAGSWWPVERIVVLPQDEEPARSYVVPPSRLALDLSTILKTEFDPGLDSEGGMNRDLTLTQWIDFKQTFAVPTTSAPTVNPTREACRFCRGTEYDLVDQLEAERCRSCGALFNLWFDQVLAGPTADVPT